MKKILLGIAVFLSAFGLFADSDSIDGLVSIAKKGEFPSGFFCRSAGYMPGDCVSITNPSNGVTLQILNLGTLDGENDCVILLSPEAASKLGVRKNAQISISSRFGRYDENVSGTAVLTKGDSGSKKKKAAKKIEENSPAAAPEIAETEPVASFDDPVPEVKAVESEAVAETPVAETEPVAVFEDSVKAAPAEEKFVDDALIEPIKDEAPVVIADEPFVEDMLSKNEETAPAAIVIEEEVLVGKTIPTVEEEVMTGKTIPTVEEEVMTGKTIPAVEEEIIPEKTKPSRNRIEKMELVPTAGVTPQKSKRSEKKAAACEEVVEKKMPAKVPETKTVVIEEEIVEPKKSEPKKSFKGAEKTEAPKPAYIYTDENQLPKNSYYIQIATLGSVENVDRNVRKYNKYPFAVISTGKNTYKLLVGPLSVDEYGSVLEKFKGFGFKDAFVKHK